MRSLRNVMHAFGAWVERIASPITVKQHRLFAKQLNLWYNLLDKLEFDEVIF